MDSRWTKGLTGKNKAERERDVKSFSRAFEELDKLLTSLYRKPSTNYDSPNWAFEQIGTIENNQALDRVRSLLKID